MEKSGKFADWEVGDDYECIKLLGQGSYGSVCSALHKPSGRKVAIKKMDGVFEDDTDCKRILREIVLLRKLKHPYIIELFDIIMPKNPQTFDTLYVVLELAESDLKKVIKSAIHLKLAHIRVLVYNLFCALKYLHTSNVLHRDLKPANVLVNEDCSVKICDFGLARAIEGQAVCELIIKETEKEIKVKAHDDDVTLKDAIFAKVDHTDDHHQDLNQAMDGLQVEEKKEEPANKRKELTKRLIKTKEQRKNMKRELTGHVVTRWYRAPELILLEKDYGPAIDVWSVGCIFAELLNMMKESAATFLERKPLFPGKSCFPLSPDKHSKQQAGGFPVNK